jgi:hypothetical protein
MKHELNVERKKIGVNEGIMRMTDNCGRDAALRRPRPRRAGGIVKKLHRWTRRGQRNALSLLLKQF